MKLKTVISWLLAVFVIGVVASIDWRQGRSEEQRLRSMEARLDSAYRIIDSLGERAERSGAVVEGLWDAAPERVQALVNDSFVAVTQRQLAKHATMQFVMVQGDTVLGTWASVQARVWDIREATPVTREMK